MSSELIVWMDDASSFSKDWLMLLASVVEQEEWQEWARPEARKFAEQFTWENAYSQWNNVINSLE